MNSFAFAFAFAAALASPASALFATGTSLVGSSLVLGSGTALTSTILPVVGAIFLKTALLAAVTSPTFNNGRKRRSTEEDEVLIDTEMNKMFTFLAGIEPARCYSKLVCEMASERVKVPDSETIMTLFNQEVPVESPIYDYTVAAAVGAKTKSSDFDLCEVRYSCPLTREEMEQLSI